MNAPPQSAAKSGKPAKQNAARNFIIVLNNFTEEELARINDRDTWPEFLRYVEYELEHVNVEGKTPHVQGWCCTWDPVRESAFKKWLRRAHFEVMRENKKASMKYCDKEGGKICIGDPPAQGFRTDIVGVKRRLDNGERLFDIQMNDEQAFSIVTKNERALEKYQNGVRFKKYLSRGRITPEIYIVYGESGVRKTKSIYDKHGVGNVYRACDLTGKWFDGYNGQPVVLYDDVKNGGIMDITLFKKWTTGDPEMVPIKGGFVPFQPEIIYFTSNHAPETWWSSASSEDWTAFKNRVWLVRRVFRDEHRQLKTELVYKNARYYNEIPPEAAVDFSATADDEACTEP